MTRSPSLTRPIPRAVRAAWNLDPFYTRYIDAGGLPVVSSRRVDGRALAVAARVVTGMLSRRPDVMATLASARIRVAIIGKTEQTTDLPDHAELRRDAQRWNRRARGFGPSVSSPVASCAEENVLRLAGDPWHGESILVHEFAHAVMDFGLAKLDPEFERRLYRLYSAATGRGLWTHTYAETGYGEYWAEGVQSYFDANAFRWIPDGVHNHVDTRVKLRRYDPCLYDLIADSLNAPKWSWLNP